MINTTLLAPGNLLFIAVVVVFARTLLNGFVKLVDNGGEGENA